jgi:hypothetical protein
MNPAREHSGDDAAKTGARRTGAGAPPCRRSWLLCKAGAVMQIVELSNHPDAMLQEIHRRRAAAEEQQRSRFEDERARHNARVKQAQDARDHARAGHRWWAWLRCILVLRRERRQVPRPPLPIRRPADREEALTAGMAGEQMAAAAFGRVLGDDWTLLRGYRNRRGEIDHLLLGPGGLIAIEGKHRNATVHCDGDDWWFDKYDRYGNLVGRGEMADRQGRSPSVQLNEPAAQLEGFLRSRGYPVPVQRVVLLTHPRSRLGNCTKATVHVATSANDVIKLARRSPAALDAQQLTQLQRLIVRDHKFHEARRPR